MIPHHPTSVELDDLRAGLMSAPSVARERNPDGRTTTLGRTWMSGTAWQSHPDHGGAWPHELAHGIGYSRAYADPRTPPLTFYGEDYGSIARREASALRSRARDATILMYASRLYAREEARSMLTPKMMPGQTPYTPEETARLYALVAAAADDDPGEQHEPPPDATYEGWSNQATWHAALIIHNEYGIYTATHYPARLALLRERPWSVGRWAFVLRVAWAEMVSAELRRETRAMDGRIDWREIAEGCAEEIAE